MAEFEVARSQGTCSVSGRALAEGEPFYAVLFENREGFARQDISVEAWQGPPEGVFCFWKSHVPRKDRKKQTLVDNHVLVEFFERLDGQDDLVKQQFRFVLALMLMRKRLLRYDETKHADGVETWHMTLASDGSTHAVVNPQLQDDEIDAVSEQLTAILHGDFLADHGERLTAVGAVGESPDGASDTATEPPQGEPSENA